MDREIASPTVFRFSKKKRLLAGSLGLMTVGLRGAFARRSTGSLRVLILEPYGMGDAISLQPLVEGLLQERYEVAVCARAAWRPLFPAEVQWVDFQVPWSAYGDKEKYRLSTLLGARVRSSFRSLRHLAEGAVGIDPRGDVRSIAMLWAAGCSRVLSLDHYLGGDLRVSNRLADTVPCERDKRRWELNLLIFQALVGTDVRVGRPDLRRRFGDLPSAVRGRIGFIPLAPWLGKQWSSSKWRVLIDMLCGEGKDVIAMGGPGQQTELGRMLGTNVPQEICSSMADWATALSKMEAVVSVDTGPMHFADALQKPLVALYGASDLPLWAPSGSGAIALHRQTDPDFTPVHPVDAGVSRGMELMDRHDTQAVKEALDLLLDPPDQDGFVQR